MWAIEYIDEMMFSYTAGLISNLIKVMSAAIIALSLLMNSKVLTLFVEKYNSVNNNFEDADTVLI